MNGADSYFWHEDPLPVPERIVRMFYIGVDPGVAGGIAVLDDRGQPVETHKMPETRRDLLDILTPFNSTGPNAPSRCVVEKVNAGVFGHGAGDRRMGVVSAFTFGRNVERVHMALVAAGVVYDEALPVKWQTALGCRTRGDKNISKARAQELFPGVKVTHAIADALLIAEFCRRTERGSISTPAPKGLFDGESEEEGRAEEAGKIRIPEGFYTDHKDAQRAEAVAKGRRARAPRRADPAEAAAGTAARRGRGSR